MLSGWCTYCAWSWCAHNYWQWSLNTGHPASQGVGCSLVSVHCSKCCRFHCHAGTTLCWDTQRVSSRASAPQPSKTHKGHWTWVSIRVMLKCYGINFINYCLFHESSIAFHFSHLQNDIAQGVKALLKIKFEIERKKCWGWWCFVLKLQLKFVLNRDVYTALVYSTVVFLKSVHVSKRCKSKMILALEFRG